MYFKCKRHEIIIFYRYIWKKYFRCVVSSSSGHFLPAPSHRGLCHWSHNVYNCRSLLRLSHPSSHWWSHRVEPARYKTYAHCCPLDNTCEFLRDIQAGFLKKSLEFRVSKGRMLNIFLKMLSNNSGNRTKVRTYKHLSLAFIVLKSNWKLLTTDLQNKWAKLLEVSNISRFQITHQMTVWFTFQAANKKRGHASTTGKVILYSFNMIQGLPFTSAYRRGNY